MTYDTSLDPISPDFNEGAFHLMPQGSMPRPQRVGQNPFITPKSEEAIAVGWPAEHVRIVSEVTHDINPDTPLLWVDRHPETCCEPATYKGNAHFEARTVGIPTCDDDVHRDCVACEVEAGDAIMVVFELDPADLIRWHTENRNGLPHSRVLAERIMVARPDLKPSDMATRQLRVRLMRTHPEAFAD